MDVLHSKRINSKAFTIVELLIVIVVVAILATIALVAYNGIQRRADESALQNVLRTTSKGVTSEYVATREAALPADYRPNENVEVSVTSGSNSKYSNLTAVQNGVLFYEVCVELIADSQYSVIHAKDGGGTSSVVMKCDDNIRAGGILITGWESKSWNTPLNESTLQAYVDSVPYDNWWTDRQQVVRGFYTALMDRFVSRGGTWPITSFWDPWANQWSGVPKEPLPALATGGSSTVYCVEARHKKHVEMIYHIRSDTDKIEAGRC